MVGRRRGGGGYIVSLGAWVRRLHLGALKGRSRIASLPLTSDPSLHPLCRSVNTQRATWSTLGWICGRTANLRPSTSWTSQVGGRMGVRRKCLPVHASFTIVRVLLLVGTSKLFPLQQTIQSCRGEGGRVHGAAAGRGAAPAGAGRATPGPYPGES